MHRLGEDFKLVALGADAIEQIGGSGLTGEQENLAAGEHGANLDGGIDPVEVGHDDVGDEHVGAESLSHFDGLLAAVDGGGIEAGLVEDDGKSIGDDALVIRDKHFGFRLLFGHSFGIASLGSD